MTTLRFEFTPDLEVLVEDDVSNLTYPTGIAGLDEEILKSLRSGRIPVAGIAEMTVKDGEADSATTRFNEANNRIEVTIPGWKSGPAELDALWATLDADDLGPDTWMEGDLSVVSEDIAQRFGYDSVDLVPKIVYAGIAEAGAEEKPIDRKTLEEPPRPKVRAPGYTATRDQFGRMIVTRTGAY